MTLNIKPDNNNLKLNPETILEKTILETKTDLSLLRENYEEITRIEQIFYNLWKKELYKFISLINLYLEELKLKPKNTKTIDT